MPPGRQVFVDFEALKPTIIEKYHSGQTCPEIALEIGASLRTLEQRIKSWGLCKRAPKIKSDDSMLRSQVAILFIGNLTDAEMVFALQQQGWKCTLCQVARIRTSQGIKRRFSAFQRQVAVQTLWELIEKELDTSTIEGYS